MNKASAHVDVRFIPDHPLIKVSHPSLELFNSCECVLATWKKITLQPCCIGKCPFVAPFEEVPVSFHRTSSDAVPSNFSQSVRVHGMHFTLFSVHAIAGRPSDAQLSLSVTALRNTA